MRKVVNVNGKKIYVYRKGHEMKHLGRTFVRLWKEGKVSLPTNGRHRLGVDRNGKIIMYANTETDRRKLPIRSWDCDETSIVRTIPKFGIP